MIRSLPVWLIPRYKVYILAIAAKHVQLDSVFLGRNSLVSNLILGVRWLRPFLLPSVSSWELSVVLEGLSGPAFELWNQPYFEF